MAKLFVDQTRDALAQAKAVRLFWKLFLAAFGMIAIGLWILSSPILWDNPKAISAKDIAIGVVPIVLGLGLAGIGVYLMIPRRPRKN